MGTADRRRNVISVTWTQVHEETRKLALALMRAHTFKGIVAVARGGLVPAGILAEECDIRLVETVCIDSCDKEHPEARVLKTFSKDEGQGWLVVDDVAATGRTALIVRTMLPKAHIAALYVKKQGLAHVDSFVCEVSQNSWLLFPWDPQVIIPPARRRIP